MALLVLRLYSISDRMINVEQLVEWELAGRPKSHMTWPGIEPGLPQWETTTRLVCWLSYNFSIYVVLTCFVLVWNFVSHLKETM
jgi:hypothetical protein